MTPKFDVKEYLERLFKIDTKEICKNCIEERRRKEDEGK